ncbi:DUF7667 family protein [Paenibacillus elgii]|uniref:DUF7667 family protein n=1 Tax=Paenibacillus elgii TaxID=189691 RepID=UPI000248E0A7|nr:hypothetical protein [Paenibacillus elgii]
MIGIHPVHRRMAELTLEAQRAGGFTQLTAREQQELYHCLAVNMDFIARLDSLKALAFHAHTMGDMEWQQQICKQIDELETKCI